MTDPVTIHLHPTTELAERVLLPGDPGWALRLAQVLTREPKMFNHNRGLWGYTGEAVADGLPLTIQATGMGGPSAAIVVSELIALGARRLVRIGTCGALDVGLRLGQLMIVTEAIADDGASRALLGGRGDRAVPASGLLAGLQAAAGADRGVTEGPIVTTDLFYDAEDRIAGWLGAGARAVEMEAATVLALAARRGVEAGAVLIVSDHVAGAAASDHVRIGDEALHEAEIRLGTLAVGALAATR